MKDFKSLKVFVAMPGTSMGNTAKYSNPESVRKNLLTPVIDRLKNRLNIQDIELIIEKEKLDSAPIHQSMFREAQTADVYIADLTGANPNVYLELGVRWALCDGVTIMIAQSVDDLKFNVFANRAFIYSPENLIEITDKIATAIENGLKNNICDSIVRLNNDTITISRLEIKALNDEINRLKKARGEDLINAAKATDNINEKLTKLIEAIEANPASAEAFLELGKTYRDASQYDKAIKTLRDAHKLRPTDSIINRELGVTYSKQKKLDDAIYYLKEAVRLSPNDAEAWSNLGGALRKLGMIEAPNSFNQKNLEEARDSYVEAHKINRYDLYSGLNIARLNILLSKWDKTLLTQAQEQFKKQVLLCRFAVQEDSNDYWRLFDLADTLFLSGEYGEAYQVYDKAISLIPKEERKDKLSSVIDPFQNYLSASVFSGVYIDEIQKIIHTLTTAMAL
ncbi:tetratricopeptide repeat protein [Spirosoma linguale]|uniref:TPR repeat-containing protein n=1 Tax=Spirosoma linguale (strain ATCC 33905 / DSM 74 / LMG 10896 / Claus 1) TaxID=504472 RepID=D2QRW7_SPILD|nr:TPR repeat-containing protein [Spirosoma linguale DSM 74]